MHCMKIKLLYQLFVTLILFSYGQATGTVGAETFTVHDDIIDDVREFTPPEFCFIYPSADDVSCTGESRDLWFYNAAEGQCLTFEDRDCVEEMRNSFRTEQECYRICTGDSRRPFLTIKKNRQFNKNDGNSFTSKDDGSSFMSGTLNENEPASKLGGRQASENFLSPTSTIPPLMNEITSAPQIQTDGEFHSFVNVLKPQEENFKLEKHRLMDGARDDIYTNLKSGFEDVKRIIGKEISDIKEFNAQNSNAQSRAVFTEDDLVGSTTMIPLMFVNSVTPELAPPTQQPNDLTRKYMREDNTDASKVILKSSDDHLENYSRKFSTEGLTTDDRTTTKYVTPGITEFEKDSRIFDKSTNLQLQNMITTDKPDSKLQERFSVKEQFDEKANITKENVIPIDDAKSHIDVNGGKHADLHDIEKVLEENAQLERIPEDKHGFETPELHQDELNNFDSFTKNSGFLGRRNPKLPLKEGQDTEINRQPFDVMEESSKLSRAVIPEVLDRSEDDNDFLYEVLPDDFSDGSQERKVNSIKLNHREANLRYRDSFEQLEPSYIKPILPNDENIEDDGERDDVKQGNLELLVAREGNDSPLAGFTTPDTISRMLDNRSDKMDSEMKSTRKDLKKQGQTIEPDNSRMATEDSTEPPERPTTTTTTTTRSLTLKNGDRFNMKYSEGKAMITAATKNESSAKAGNTTDGFIKIIRGNLRFFRPPPIQFRPVEDPTWSILNELAAPLFPLLPLSGLALNKNMEKKTFGHPPVTELKRKSSDHIRQTEDKRPAMKENIRHGPFKLISPNIFRNEQYKAEPSNPRAILPPRGEMRQRILMAPPTIFLSPDISSRHGNLPEIQSPGMSKESMHWEINSPAKLDNSRRWDLVRSSNNVQPKSNDEYKELRNDDREVGKREMSSAENQGREILPRPRISISNRFGFWTPLNMLMSRKLQGGPQPSVIALKTLPHRHDEMGPFRDVSQGRKIQENFGAPLPNGRRMYSLHLTARYNPSGFVGLSRTVSMQPLNLNLNYKNFRNEMFGGHPQGRFESFRRDDSFLHPNSGPSNPQNSHRLAFDRYDNIPQPFHSREDTHRYISRSPPFAPRMMGPTVEENYRELNFKEQNPLKEDIGRRISPHYYESDEDHQPGRGEFVPADSFSRDHNQARQDTDDSHPRQHQINHLPDVTARELNADEDRQYMAGERDLAENIEQLKDSSSNRFDFEIEDDQKEVKFSGNNNDRREGVKSSASQPSISKSSTRRKSSRPANVNISPKNQFTLMQIFVNKDGERQYYPMPQPMTPLQVMAENPPIGSGSPRYPQIPFDGPRESLSSPWNQDIVRSGGSPRSGLETKRPEDPDHNKINNGQRSMIEIDDEMYRPHHSACYQPLHLGDCKSIEVRWYYNAYLGRCEMFQYGGCGGNDNRFTSYETCVEVCITEKPKEEEVKISTTIIPATVISSDTKKPDQTSERIEATTESVTSRPSTVSAVVQQPERDITQADVNDHSVKKTKLESSNEEKENKTDGILSMQYIIMAAAIGVVALLVIVLGACGLAHMCRKRRRNKELTIEDVAKANIYGVANIMYPESVVHEDKDSGSVKISNTEQPEV